MSELIEKIKKARFVFICGNGGSASTAEHFTTDLVKKGIKAICLNSNTSVMTMIANDYGYEYIFSKQLEVYGDKKDLLITISCSGKSKNIVYALAQARLMEVKTYQFKSFTLSSRDYGELENQHLVLAHSAAKGI